MPPTVRDPGHSSNDHEMDSLGATHLFTTVTRVAYLMSERSERKNLVATVIAAGGGTKSEEDERCRHHPICHEGPVSLVSSDFRNLPERRDGEPMPTSEERNA